MKAGVRVQVVYGWCVHVAGIDDEVQPVVQGTCVSSSVTTGGHQHDARGPVHRPGTQETGRKLVRRESAVYEITLHG